MGKSKFIAKVEALLGIKRDEELSKKEAIKNLLEKLKEKELSVKKELKKSKGSREEADLKDSLHVIKKQIKKAEELL